MKGLSFFSSMFLFLLCISFMTETEAGLINGDGVYIVYMGSASSAANAYRAQILINTMFKRLYTLLNMTCVCYIHIVLFCGL